MSVPPNGAVLLFSESAIERTLDRLAVQIDLDLVGAEVVGLCVLRGGSPFAWDLVRRLRLNLTLEFVQVQRYRGLVGDEPRVVGPLPQNLQGRSVLIMDDVLDYGITLKFLKDQISTFTEKVYTAVLVRKKLSQPPNIEADYVGLYAPDKFLIGRGMDLDGKYRDLPAIYAIPEA
ncbi:MAG: hypoxanthine-guanine phosphoribosyltransferase [Gammaproteobacteria bacterium]|nr:hypoxanthine-guanine phosphoribosyltransferase [Gammaproteobacteria bacterium]